MCDLDVDQQNSLTHRVGAIEASLLKVQHLVAEAATTAWMDHDKLLAELTHTIAAAESARTWVATRAGVA